MEKLGNVAYESALISLLLVADTDKIIEVSTTLKESEFSSKLHGGLWGIIKLLTNQNRDITVLNILSEVKKYPKLLSAFGGEEKTIDTVDALMNDNNTSDDVQFYIDEIKKYAIGRKLVDESDKLKYSIYNDIDNMTLSDVVSLPQRLNVEVTNTLDTCGIQIAYGMDAYLKKDTDDIGRLLGIPSKYDFINKATLGYRKGQLYVYSGYTNEGKSLLLLNEAQNLSLNEGIAVLYIDTEMSAEEQQPRLLSMRTGIRTDEIELGIFLRNARKRQLIESEIQAIKNSKLYLASVDDFDIDVLGQIIRYHIVRHKIQVVVFDYIKLPTVTKTGGLNETQQLGNLTDFLKNRVAKKHDLVVISACQTDEHERNRVADSARIKRFSSFLANWRKKPYSQRKKEGFDLGTHELEIQKNRNGPKDIIGYFGFNGDSTEIIEVKGDHSTELF